MCYTIYAVYGPTAICRASITIHRRDRNVIVPSEIVTRTNTRMHTGARACAVVRDSRGTQTQRMLSSRDGVPLVSVTSARQSRSTPVCCPSRSFYAHLPLSTSQGAMRDCLSTCVVACDVAVPCHLSVFTVARRDSCGSARWFELSSNKVIGFVFAPRYVQH